MPTLNSNPVELDPFQRLQLWTDALKRENTVMANDLHDNLAQIIMALRLEISLLKLNYALDSCIQTHAQAMLSLTDQSLFIVRHYVNQSKIYTDESNLADFLQNLCENFSKSYKIPCNLTIKTKAIKELPVDWHGLILRIFQEALNNIAQHAQASCVKIVLKKNQHKGLDILIQDDGIGFDLQNSQPQNNQLGFRLMQDCLLVMLGQMQILSKKDQGTTLAIQIPLLA